MKNIIATILIIGSLGLFFGFIQSEYATVNAKRDQIAQYDKALDNAKQLRSERDAQIKKYNSFNPTDIARLTKLLPDGVDNIRLILDINDVASRYGMSIKNIKIDQAANTANSTSQIGPNTNPYGSLQISFSVTSTYENFRLFMQDLERNLRLVDITTLSFSANKDTTYTFNLGMKTYWLK